MHLYYGYAVISHSLHFRSVSSTINLHFILPIFPDFFLSPFFLQKKIKTRTKPKLFLRSVKNKGKAKNNWSNKKKTVSVRSVALTCGALTFPAKHYLNQCNAPSEKQNSAGKSCRASAGTEKMRKTVIAEHYTPTFLLYGLSLFTYAQETVQYVATQCSRKDTLCSILKYVTLLYVRRRSTT